MSAVERIETESTAWWAIPADEVAARFDVDPVEGLSTGEVAARLGRYGPNEIAKEPPPTTWEIARGQLTTR